MLLCRLYKLYKLLFFWENKGFDTRLFFILSRKYNHQNWEFILTKSKTTYSTHLFGTVIIPLNVARGFIVPDELGYITPIGVYKDKKDVILQLPGNKVGLSSPPIQIS